MSNIKNLTTDHIRNIAIIAHVDHGKTTLVDAMLQQSGIFQEHEQLTERVLDSNDLEKERGITILAKCTAILWNNYKINIIDTPGHADFGGEVERILSMVDGVILLVDSSEGPMAQTKFVLGKALQLNLKPLVIINKLDRPDRRVNEVLNEIFDLFISLNASDEQADFLTLYGSGRDGWVSLEPDIQTENLNLVFEKIIECVPAPKGEVNQPFQFLVTLLENDPYLGRVLTGKIYGGKPTVNSLAKSITLEGNPIEKARITKIQTFLGIKKINVEEGLAGDIVRIAGFKQTSVSDTICDENLTLPLPALPIDPPTISITLGINTSPFTGLDGSKVTNTVIQARLYKEIENNIALTINTLPDHGMLEVMGRGELQLGILIENMRREGFELSVSRPRVIFRKDAKGHRLEPIEEVTIDIDEQYSGTVIKKMDLRKAQLQDMTTTHSMTRLVFHVPARGLIGYRNEFLTDTRGTGIINRIFLGYEPYRGDISNFRNGALVATAQGETVAYGIFKLQDRGTMFVKPQDKIYKGMIVGEHNRENDLIVNILREKKLTNVRSAAADENIILHTPRRMSLEEMMSYIKDDELIEVTPKTLRLRKKDLNKKIYG